MADHSQTASTIIHRRFVSMDLLTNAIESIRVGVEDFEVGSTSRLISAVRNIHAGVLLLFKEALRRKSPANSNEVLVKARMRPTLGLDHKLAMVGVGRRTVDAREIRVRFVSLNIRTDWSGYQRIAELRNDLEHYSADLIPETVKGAIASAFLIIRSFAVEELKENARELLGNLTWEKMLKIAEVYGAERIECDKSIDQFGWESATLEKGVRRLRCPTCLSDLLSLDGNEGDIVGITMSCRTCGHTMIAEEFVPAAIAQELEFESYFAARDGSDEPFAVCPECCMPAYVLSEEFCALCGSSVPDRECARCAAKIPVGSSSSSVLCNYCDALMSKDD